MQINELRKSRANIGGIGDTVGKTKQKVQSENAGKGDKNRLTEESFQDSLQKSMNVESFSEPGVSVVNNESEWRPDNTGRPGSSVISHKDAGLCKNKAEGIGIRIERSGEPAAAKEVEVRRISYGECDKVEINVLEGYTLKAKLEADGEGNDFGGCRIYVEMKDEEGTMKACLFDGAGLQKNSRNVMERIAYTVMHDGEEG